MFVKICGITNEDDALFAVAMGADAVGFVFAPSPRQIAPQQAYDITRRLPPEVLTVGVFRDELPGRVVEVAHKAGVKAVQLHGRETPDLDNAYGELMVRAAGGQVPDNAVSAFRAALAADPKNVPARFYLGEAAAQKGDRATAQRYWQSLLDEVPATMPLHSALVDRLASIGAAPPAVAGAGGAPDIGAMVAGLAARLKASPNDPAGWIAHYTGDNIAEGVPTYEAA